MGASRVYQAGSPYNGVELADLDYEQTADTLYLAHLSHPPTKLVRSSNTNWSFNTVQFTPTIAAPASCTISATVADTDVANNGLNYFPETAKYCVTAVDDNTTEESRASPTASAYNDLTLKRNYNTLTWTAASRATRYNIYKADNTQFYGYIGTTTSLTFIDDNIGPAYTQAPPMANNPFSSAGNYPSTVTLFEQRSIWARSTNVPHGIWTSKSGLIENMDYSTPLRADDGMSFAIMAGRVNSVNQLTSTTSLLALTSDSVFAIAGSAGGGPLNGSTPPSIQRQVGRGSSRLPPLVVDNVVFYVPSIGCSIRSLGYNYVINGLRANDITIFSPHFFEGHTIVSWCYSQEPRSLIWAARDDGALLCFTWEQEQNVWGWTLCETAGNVLSVCSITENGEDRVYLIVERTIAGKTSCFVERMVSHLWDTPSDCCFLDCAVSASLAAPQSTFTGLWHLEGCTNVAGLADGVPVSGLTVTNGTITLPSSIGTASNVSFGLPYEVDIETLPLRITMPGAGSNIGRMQNPAKAVLTLRETGPIEAGIGSQDLFPVVPRATDAPNALYDGTYQVTMDNKVRDECTVWIRQTAPMPFTLLGVAVDPVIGG
ncbi:hypothetical protein [Novosphingobium sp. Fuku2-ISO-50]|uniref:hypothetical protein n=1 Tax=Novosphingobium sp. Fuku2-ISO-50 TaxID=1739114 RepID=UPI00076CA214|nr:hypothetical protein [Novosphingobium sp. Fuku2-ISO-50]KUR73334.1 hypothetical protein AQZ50_19240 [Novosphingobium sp. Fuku2-ISO-50]